VPDRVAGSGSAPSGGAAPAIDHGRLIDDLTALVRIPSISGSDESVMAWSAYALRDLGLAV